MYQGTDVEEFLLIGRHELVRAVVLGEERDAIFAAEEGGGSRPCGGVIDVHLADSESLESAR